MKRIVLISLICCAINVAKSAQDPQSAQQDKMQGPPLVQTQPSEDEPSALYIQVMVQWAKTTDFAKNAAEVIVGKLKMDMENDPKLKKVLTKEMMLDLEQFFYELFLSPQTMKELAKLYSQYFTIDEMQDLMRFYQTPLGKKLIKADPELRVKTQQIGARLLKSHEKEYMAVVAKYIAPEKK